ncbi:MAG: hypothetical protein ACFFER_08750 [Candidatus Thorarchaeota archaeon]
MSSEGGEYGGKSREYDEDTEETKEGTDESREDEEEYDSWDQRIADEIADELREQEEAEETARELAEELEEEEVREANESEKDIFDDIEDVRDRQHDDFVHDMHEQCPATEAFSEEARRYYETEDSEEETDSTETTDSYHDSGDGTLQVQKVESESQTETNHASEVEEAPDEEPSSMEGTSHETAEADATQNEADDQIPSAETPEQAHEQESPEAFDDNPEAAQTLEASEGDLERQKSTEGGQRTEQSTLDEFTEQHESTDEVKETLDESKEDASDAPSPEGATDSEQSREEYDSEEQAREVDETADQDLEGVKHIESETEDDVAETQSHAEGQSEVEETSDCEAQEDTTDAVQEVENETSTDDASESETEGEESATETEEVEVDSDEEEDQELAEILEALADHPSVKRDLWSGELYIDEGMHPPSMFPESREERLSRELEDIWESLSEEEREKIKPLLFKDIDSEEDLGEALKQIPEVWDDSDFLVAQRDAIEYLNKAEEEREKIKPPRLIVNLQKQIAERRWSALLKLAKEYGSKETRERRAISAFERMKDAYGQMYFYFPDKAAFDDYVQEVGLALGIDDKEELLKHLTQQSSEMASGRYSAFQPRYNRIKGEFLYMLNRITGKSLPDLEGKISKLTKHSGRGGIKNPRFPSGPELEIALARLIATAVSDCHLKPNGTLEYSEPELDRIRRVEENLRIFGDISLNPKLVKRDNYYISYFPAPLGMMLQHWGMPAGDRTIQNPGLFSWIFDFCWEALCAFMEDLIPQDGSVRSNVISWSHSHALHPGDKIRRYKTEHLIGTQEIELIKKHGRKEKYCWVLSLAKLRELEESEDPKEAKSASFLLKVLYDNPNKLSEDGKKIAEKLEIKISIDPSNIRYYRRSGRVSIAWTARTKGVLQAMKLAIIAPPNDVKKRTLLRNVLRRKSKFVEQALLELRDSGVDIEEWWL